VGFWRPLVVSGGTNIPAKSPPEHDREWVVIRIRREDRRDFRQNPTDNGPTEDDGETATFVIAQRPAPAAAAPSGFGSLPAGIR
jgi:hypothetical protein